MNAVEERQDVAFDLVSVLTTLVFSFCTAPVASGKKMRELLHLSPDAFRIASISVLQDSKDVRGCRYLVTLLWTHSLLIPSLSDTSLPIGVALSLAATAAEVDPHLYLKLMQFLVDSMLDSQDLSEEAGSRLLEILGSIGDATGIQPFLRRILLHPSARIRSKAGLLVGRSRAGGRALEKLLSDENERVRANAAEALWGGDLEHALPIFSRLLDDKNHRVVGNAIIGLYGLGDLRSLAAIRDLNGHSHSMFRAAGIWVMGRTRDPRYLPQLGRMLAASSGPTRRTIFNAVNSIKKAAGERALNPRLHMTALNMATNESGVITAQIVIEGQNNSAPPSVRPTGFSITVDQLPVSTFECAERRNDSMAISLVLPSRATENDHWSTLVEDAALETLENKPRKEPWSISRYTPIRASETTPAVHPAAAYATDCASLSAILINRSTGLDPQLDWFRAVSIALSGQPSGRDSRQLITFVHSTIEIEAASIEELYTLAAGNRFSINVLSQQPDQRIANLCAATGGYYRSIGSAEDIEHALPLLFAAVRSSFLLSFIRPESPEGIPVKVRVQVHSDTQVGETEWQN